MTQTNDQTPLDVYNALAPDDQHKVDTLVLQAMEQRLVLVGNRASDALTLDTARTVSRTLDNPEVVNHERSNVITILGTKTIPHDSYYVTDLLDPQTLHKNLKDVVVDPRVLDGVQSTDISVPNLMRSRTVINNTVVD